MSAWREQLERDGFAVLPGVFSPAEVCAALEEWDEVTRRVIAAATAALGALPAEPDAPKRVSQET